MIDKLHTPNFANLISEDKVGDTVWEKVLEEAKVKGECDCCMREMRCIIMNCWNGNGGRKSE